MIRILTQTQYELFLAQQGRIEQLQKENEQLQKQNKILKNDKNILLNIINPDILGLDFPNTTEERGSTGEAETPINFSDIIEL